MMRKKNKWKRPHVKDGRSMVSFAPVEVMWSAKADRRYRRYAHELVNYKFLPRHQLDEAQKRFSQLRHITFGLPGNIAWKDGQPYYRKGHTVSVDANPDFSLRPRVELDDTHLKGFYSHGRDPQDVRMGPIRGLSPDGAKVAAQLADAIVAEYFSMATYKGSISPKDIIPDIDKFFPGNN